MTSQELLFYSLALGFLVLAGFISLAAYRLAKSLESLKVLIDNLEDTTKDLNIIKNKIKLGALTSIASLLKIFLKRR